MTTDSCQKYENQEVFDLIDGRDPKKIEWKDMSQTPDLHPLMQRF